MKAAVRLLATLVCAAVFGAAVSCGGGGGSGSGSNASNSPTSSGLPACSGNAIFSVSPMDLNVITGWEPLGHFNPPGHTFPTDHQYLYFIDPNLHQPASALPVYAPADIRVTLLTRSAGASGGDDFAIYFQPCGDLFSVFGHLSALSGPLASLSGSVTQHCSTYSPSPNQPVTSCDSGTLLVDIKAGTQIGLSAGGGSFGLDWVLQDRRVTPLHFTSPSRFSNGSGGFDTLHTVAASEYLTPALAAQAAPKIGRFDGAVKRTVLPLGGTISVDVDGTARGYWFNPAQAYPPESYHAALAPDYVQPDKLQSFSLGVTQANFGVLIQNFQPTTTGSVNRAFETVTADGNTYCYESNVNLFYGGGNWVVLLQLVTAGTLKIEVRPGFANCAAASPYTFTAAAVTYQR